MGGILRSKLSIAIFSLVALAVISQVVLHTPTAHAKNLSWTDSLPTIVDSTRIADISGESSCEHEYSLRDVTGETEPKQICRNQGGPVTVGTYFSSDHFEHVIGFGLDSKMYHLYTAACELYDSCLYVPQSDMLISRQYLGSNGIRSLAIYKNFSKRVTKILNPYLPYFQFEFDASRPDYTFTNSRGDLWPVGGVGVSGNGKWLALEFRQRGIGLLNLETFDMRRISALNFGYGFGSDPTSELAVTDDGAHVAVMGSNAGIAILDVNSECGETVTDLVMFSTDYMEKPCRSAPINRQAIIQGFHNALHPHFENDDEELLLYAQSYSGEQREVILGVPGYAGPRMDYLALGDSFSSGEGEIDDTHYLNGTNDTFEKCHISDRSYPYLIARYLGIEAQYMRSVACSGATMDDVIGSDYNFWGQADRLSTKGLNLNIEAKTLSQTSAKADFIPGRVHQSRFAELYHPKIITIGIGGNDAGLMQKLRTCVGLDTCEWAATPDGREKTAVEIKSIFNNLVNTYTQIHVASPSSKIYVVGYPKVIDENGQCGPLDGLLLNSTERKFMNEAISYMNEIIRAAAKKAGVAYIDSQNSLGEQTLCGSVKPSVMNAIRVGDDDALSQNIDWAKLIGQESFHPQPQAHQMIFANIVQSVPDLLTYVNCSNGQVVCPDTTVTVPQPSDYWIKDSIWHSYAAQKSTRFTDEVIQDNSVQTQVSIPDYSFAPGSSVQVEVHSTPQQLGVFMASEKGAGLVNVHLPNTLEFGYHTIHLIGVDYGGESIDYYQVINYTNHNQTQTSLPVDSEVSSVAPRNDASTSSNSINTDNSNSVAVSDNDHLASSRLVPQSGKNIITDLAATPVKERTNNPVVVIFLSLLSCLVLGSLTYLIISRFRVATDTNHQ